MSQIGAQLPNLLQYVNCLMPSTSKSGDSGSLDSDSVEVVVFVVVVAVVSSSSRGRGVGLSRNILHLGWWIPGHTLFGCTPSPWVYTLPLVLILLRYIKL